MGLLQVDTHHNRKYFPKIRNIHQFEYTHHHPNNYASTFQKFFSNNKHAEKVERAKKNTNQSTVQFGTDNKNYYHSLAKTDYKAFDKVNPAKQIKQKEEGFDLGTDKPDQHFKTTVQERFGHFTDK